MAARARSAKESEQNWECSKVYLSFLGQTHFREQAEKVWPDLGGQEGSGLALQGRKRGCISQHQIIQTTEVEVGGGRLAASHFLSA